MAYTEDELWETLEQMNSQQLREVQQGVARMLRGREIQFAQECKSRWVEPRLVLRKKNDGIPHK